MRSCAPPALSRLVPRFLALCAISCAMALAGCARNPSQRGLDPGLHEVKAAPVRAAGRIIRSPERYRSTGPQLPRLRQPDLALLAPQPAPDCEYKRSDLKTVDPDEWARLKVEFERECYQSAEKAARERLSLLQASSTCEIEPARQQRPSRRRSRSRNRQS